MQILRRLGFDVHVQLPYGLMVNYLKVLELTEHEVIPQKAWGYLNDAVCCNLACCAFFSGQITNLSAMFFLDIYLHMENIARHLMRLYAFKLPSNLPLTLEELETYMDLQKTIDSKSKPVVDSNLDDSAKG
ncbi:11963_t:CDS:2, partial [Acaulospora morrowiae]